MEKLRSILNKFNHELLKNLEEKLITLDLSKATDWSDLKTLRKVRVEYEVCREKL